MLGFLNVASALGYAAPLAAFLKGLSEAGYVEGRNVDIEYRWAEGHSDRLPVLANELISKTGDSDCRNQHAGGDCGKDGNYDNSDCL